MNIDLDTTIGVIGVAVGLLGIGYAFGANRKLKEVSDVVGKSVEDMVADGKIKISQDIVDTVVKERVSLRVDCEVRDAVNTACRDVTTSVKTTMYNKIADAAEKAVNTTYKTMESEAKEQLRKEIRNIDISDLKREVKSEAKDAVAEKLQSSMDDILESYNSNLANIQTIYGSIAKTMSGAIG